MRGSKAKQLRKYANTVIQHGTKFHVLKSNEKQTLSSPQRYLYQFLKGKNTQLGFTA